MKAKSLEGRNDLEYQRNDRAMLGQLLREYNDVATSEERNSEIIRALSALGANPDYFNGNRLNDAGEQAIGALVKNHYQEMQVDTRDKDIYILRVVNNLYLKKRNDNFKELDPGDNIPEDVGIRSGINKVNVLTFKEAKIKKFFTISPGFLPKHIFAARLSRLFMQNTPKIRLIGNNGSLASKDVGSESFHEFEEFHTKWILQSTGTGFAELMVNAMLTRDCDVHGDNVRTDRFGHTVRIDYDGVFGYTSSSYSLDRFDFNSLNFEAVIPRVPFNDSVFRNQLANSYQFKCEMFKAVLKVSVYPSTLLRAQEKECFEYVINNNNPYSGNFKHETAEERNAMSSEFLQRLEILKKIAMENPEFREYLKVANIDDIIMELELCEDGKAAARLREFYPEMKAKFLEIKRQALGADVEINPDQELLREHQQKISQSLETHEANPIVARDRIHLTPRLKEALEAQNQEEARAIMANMSDFNYRTESSPGVLTVALQNEMFDLIPELLDRGADPLLQFVGEHATAYLTAVAAGRVDIIEKLAEKGLTFNHFDKEGINALASALAVDDPSVQMVQALIEGGANVNQCDIQGNSLLVHAIARNTPEEIVDIILMHTDPQYDTINAEGQPLFMQCALISNAENLSTLEKMVGNNKGIVNMKNDDGLTPLFAAQDEAVIDFLIEHGADINARNIEGDNALAFAVNAGNDEVVNALLNRNIEITPSAFNLAVSENPELAMRMLEDHNYIPTLESLSFACTLDTVNEELLTATIEKGKLNPNEQDADGNCPMIIAAASPKSDALQVLQAKGGDLQIKTENGDTLCMVAIQAVGRLTDTLKFLLDSQSIDLNEANNAKQTPLSVVLDRIEERTLHHRDCRNDLEIAIALVNGGANISTLSSRGTSLPVLFEKNKKSLYSDTRENFELAIKQAHEKQTTVPPQFAAVMNDRTAFKQDFEDLVHAQERAAISESKAESAQELDKFIAKYGEKIKEAGGMDAFIDKMRLNSSTLKSDVLEAAKAKIEEKLGLGTSVHETPPSIVK